MLRRLFTILSALSLILCLAAASLWVRGWFVTDRWLFVGESWVTGLASPKNGVVFSWQRSSDMSSRLLRGFDHVTDRPAQGAAWWNMADDFAVHETLSHYSWGGGGFGYSLWKDDSSRDLLLPLWFVCAISGAMPTAWLIGGLRRRGRRRGGYCLNCGYDLRATPVRCPECGTETKKPASRPHQL